MVVELPSLRGLLAQMEPQLRAEFLRFTRVLRDSDNLTDISRLIERGQLDQALRMLGPAAEGLGSAWAAAFVAAGRKTAADMARMIGVVLNFDQVNQRAVSAMQANRGRLIRELMEEQRRATTAAIVEGIVRGENPRRQALRFRDSIGLTAHQQKSVDNYRTSLETGDRAALERALRDRRFDPTVRRAARGELALTTTQVDKLASRYRERLLAHRAEVIARTEALRSVHEGANEMFQQAIGSGVLVPDQVVQEWNTAGDGRVRDSHGAMHGQTRQLGEAFVTGNGNQLKYPGDSSAPGSETIQCRCSVGTRILAEEEIAV